jgi:DNA-binding transcriptional MocR family regulator
LHEQVAGELRWAIAEGQATPGERLPPARDLAAVLGVNSNTVLLPSGRRWNNPRHRTASLPSHLGRGGRQSRRAAWAERRRQHALALQDSSSRGR